MALLSGAIGAIAGGGAGFAGVVEAVAIDGGGFAGVVESVAIDGGGRFGFCDEADAFACTATCSVMLSVTVW